MKKPVILIGVLLFLISISTINAITNDGNPTIIEGEECIRFHSFTFINTSLQLYYKGEAQPGEELEFSVSFYNITAGIIYSVTTELYEFSENLTLHEGPTIDSKPAMNSDPFSTTWVISSNTEGNFTFLINSVVSVSYTEYHASYDATYEYWFMGTFVVSEDATVQPYIAPYPSYGEIYIPLDIKVVTGQILGFLSVLFVYLSIQLGLPERKAKIRKIYSLTAAQCRDIHCNLGYLAVSSIILHNIILSQSIWGLYFKWFEFYPTFHVFRQGSNTLSWGLDLAVLGSLLLIISTITGVFFKKIARKFGYRTAIFSQQISYLALILSVIHAAFNGTWTGGSSILLLIQIGMVIEVIISRYVAYVHVYDKKLTQRTQKKFSKTA